MQLAKLPEDLEDIEYHVKPTRLGNRVIDSRQMEARARDVRPVPKTSWVTTDANKHSHCWNAIVQNKEHVPSWWTCVGIRWGCNRASISIARERWEESSLAHAVTMRTHYRAKERHGGCRA